MLGRIPGNGTGPATQFRPAPEPHAPVWCAGSGPIVFFVPGANGSGAGAGVYATEADDYTDVRVIPGSQNAFYSRPACSADGTRVAFLRPRIGIGTDPGVAEIAVASVEGGGPVQSVPLPADDDIFFHRDLAWSPDGSMMAFVGADTGDVGDIYIVAWPSGDVQNVTRHPADDRDPAWSPDGRQLVFSSNRDGDHYELWAVEADGTEVQRLTDSPSSVDNRYPVWVSAP